jgi:GMP synthase (glutamine-hydrolysing)
MFWSLGVPVLGICYGMQTMAVQLGGAVRAGRGQEFGYAEIRAHGHSRLLDGIEDRVNAAGHGLLDVWMSHGDRVSALPAGFKRIASTADVPLAGMADERAATTPCSSTPRSPTPPRARIYERFVHDICGCEAPGPPATSSRTRSPRCAGRWAHGKVLLGLSGGVDSSVVAALLHRAIGDQLTCVFVDTACCATTKATR